MTTTRVALGFGLVAEVVVDDACDRPPFVAPPVPRYAHHPACGCEVCRMARVLGKKSA